ncbi:MAG: type II toxin-antitoxin system RelE/ParE family toxin [Myxococcales bacterium]|nr:type II toxin-antitoxin system RelE/ParE family toxin [Myxococcales bacterium]
MAVYTVTILPEALRALEKLPKEVQRRIRDKIDRLAHNPRPPGVKALQGSERGYLRLRVGDYRLIYRVEDEQLLVLVVRIGHRREIYR